jgi:hypothetical protein
MFHRSFTHYTRTRIKTKRGPASECGEAGLIFRHSVVSLSGPFRPRLSNETAY